MIRLSLRSVQQFLPVIHLLLGFPMLTSLRGTNKCLPYARKIYVDAAAALSRFYYSSGTIDIEVVQIYTLLMHRSNLSRCCE